MRSAPQPVALTVIVPVYNERYLVQASLQRLGALADSPHLSRVQVVVVDDCSTDGTNEILAAFAPSAPRFNGKFEWLFLRHAVNQGKGGAVRTAIEQANGDVAVIHDADLEYDPADLPQMLPLFHTQAADAVYGSRYLAGRFRRVLFYRHTMGNKLLTRLCNLACDLDLTDMETCYKMVRTELLKSIPIVSNDFRIEPELTIKLAKRGARIFEVPISYSGRTYQEGKKIGWRDGVKALAAIVRFRLSDRICKPDQYGSEMVPRLNRAPRYIEWFAGRVRPLIGGRVLELGAGVGQLTVRLIPRAVYWATDPNPMFVHELRKLQATRPYLHAALVDPTQPETLPHGQQFDTIICQNVLEHVANDAAALGALVPLLSESGRIVAMVPHGPGLCGSFDQLLGHQRRYSRQSLRDLCAAAGLSLVSTMPMNRLGAAPWWVNSRLLRRKRLGAFQIKVLNALTPMLRRVDRFLPLPPLTLIAVMEPAPRPAKVNPEPRVPAAEHPVIG